MNIQLFGVYASAVVLLCLTPGPNSLLAITNGLRYGVRKAFFSTLGCACGLTVLIAACLSGLGFILSTSELAFMVIKWLGAGYLIYLGILLIRSDASLENARSNQHVQSDRSNSGLFIQGFLVIATNPKVLLFFTAFLPQFYVQESSFWWQFIVMAGTFVVIEVTLEICLAGFAEKIHRYTRSTKRMRIFNRLTGGIFVSAGMFLLTFERPR
ncbi:MAG: flagellar biosynthesis protein FlgM [marine bacterium B5-7]|nr:MAG: flagellar biosynthesis protein FlgM [marine bacterium B5-7]